IRSAGSCSPDGGPATRAAGSPPWAEVLRRHARFQVAVAPRAAGLAVFDRRPTSLPRQFEEILGRRPETDRLRAAHAAFEEACERLVPAPGHDRPRRLPRRQRLRRRPRLRLGRRGGRAPVLDRRGRAAGGARSVDAFLEPWDELAPRSELLAHFLGEKPG